AKLGRLRSDNLPYDLPGNSQFSANRFDRLALSKKSPADLRNSLHNQHPNLGFQESWKPLWTLCPVVPIGCRSPRKRGPYSTPKLREGDDVVILARPTHALDLGKYLLLCFVKFTHFSGPVSNGFKPRSAHFTTCSTSSRPSQRRCLATSLPVQ